MNDEPFAFFITWSVYGTFLQGDHRGWRKWKAGTQLPQPQLAQWRAERLNQPILLLDDDQRHCVEREITRLCVFRNWKLWAVSCRTNHLHVVVHADGHRGSKVRDQLKANCTRVLRERWSQFRDRSIWTEGGDWQCINSENDLEQVILYVLEAQDRKGLDAQ